LEEKVAAAIKKAENMAVWICHADHLPPSIRKKLALTSPISGGRSFGIVRSRTQTTKFSFRYQIQRHVLLPKLDAAANLHLALYIHLGRQTL
jgi:hypothetical protein